MFPRYAGVYFHFGCKRNNFHLNTRINIIFASLKRHGLHFRACGKHALYMQSLIYSYITYSLIASRICAHDILHINFNCTMLFCLLQRYRCRRRPRVPPKWKAVPVKKVSIQYFNLQCHSSKIKNCCNETKSYRTRTAVYNLLFLIRVASITRLLGNKVVLQSSPYPLFYSGRWIYDVT